MIPTQINQVFRSATPFLLKSGKSLPSFQLVYQTWGELNENRSNAILIFHALSGDSHVCGAHADGRTAGWWEMMVGPGKALDTNRYYIICANVLGGCKGSTGPASISPETQKPYGAAFPLITIEDMARSQMLLLEHLGIFSLHAVVGGMLALSFSTEFPSFAERAIIMASATSQHAQAIAWDDIGRRVDHKFLSTPSPLGFTWAMTMRITY